MITDYTKQTELIDVDEFDIPINVIGCGALGSWLTFFLLKMGFKNVNVYDFDTVEEHNIPNQIFKENQINLAKVTAMKEIYMDFFEDDVKRLKCFDRKVTKPAANKLEGIVFCCVDDMNARKYIYEECFKTGKATLFIEGRIGLFGAYVYTLNEKDPVMLAKYEATLYENEEAEVSACGVSQTALPAAVNCASLMLMQMISWYRKNNITNAIQYQIPDLLCFRETYSEV